MDAFMSDAPSASVPSMSSRSQSRASYMSRATGYDYDSTVPSSSSFGYGTPSAAGRSAIQARRTTVSRATFTSRTKSRATSSIPRSASVVGASEGHEIICAVSESRGISPSVGIALLNVTTGEAILSQVNDTQFYMRTILKIEVFEPAKILVPSTFLPPNPESTLLSLLEKSENLPNSTIIPVGRKYWSESTGLELVQQLAFLDDIESIKLSLEGKYYALCSFAAVMSYLELEVSLRIANHSLRISYQPCEESMMIDLPTIHALELIQNSRDPKSKACLLGLLDHTQTPMGSRSLRSSILQPSTVNATLEDRYDAVEELSTKEDMFHEVRKALQEFSDIEKLLTKLIILPKEDCVQAAEQAINNVLRIKTFLSAVLPFQEALASARSDLIVGARDLCRRDLINELLARIAMMINDEAVYVTKPLDLRNQRIYAVKSGVHSLLDVARKTYKEATNDLQEYVTELNTRLDVAGELAYEQKRRYFLRFQSIAFDDGAMPEELVNCVRVKDTIECQTLQLIKFNQHISASEAEVLMQSDGVAKELLQDLSLHSSTLFKICEAIALVDTLASFAQLASTQGNYTRPHLGDTMALEGARHPIIDAYRKGNFVPNNYFATDLHRFQIITGCNKSGKSTYIKAVALLQVIAQVGCFVPATYAGLSVIRNLFSRISTDDSIEGNLSSFSLEMREMAYIQRNIDDSSLAIIDELGRGTSTRDGLSIALAMTKALIHTGARIFFATHFSEIANIFKSRPGVLTFHMATETSQSEDDEHPKLTMMYKLEEGPLAEQAYGIKLARAVGFPPAVMEDAERFQVILQNNAQAQQKSAQAKRTERRRALVLGLREKLQQAHDSPMTDEELRDHLRRLQVTFAQQMSEVLEDAPTGDEAAQPSSGLFLSDHQEDPVQGGSTDSRTLSSSSSPLGHLGRPHSSLTSSSLSSSCLERLRKAGLDSRSTSSALRE